jgi:hypothetical protein
MSVQTKMSGSFRTIFIQGIFGTNKWKKFQSFTINKHKKSWLPKFGEVIYEIKLLSTLTLATENICIGHLNKNLTLWENSYSHLSLEK